MNSLKIIKAPAYEFTPWIAVFTGETGSGELVTEEEGHNIQGDCIEDVIQNALLIWGADEDETLVQVIE